LVFFSKKRKYSGTQRCRKISNRCISVTGSNVEFFFRLKKNNHYENESIACSFFTDLRGRKATYFKISTNKSCKYDCELYICISLKWPMIHYSGTNSNYQSFMGYLYKHTYIHTHNTYDYLLRNDKNYQQSKLA
jgi:hypothetical protein